MSISGELIRGASRYAVFKSWCRLCAQSDEQNLNISLVGVDADTKAENRKHSELSFSNAIKCYFDVEIKYDDLLPNRLCDKCFSLVSSLINFKNRVAKVQQMYVAYKTFQDNTEVDISALRLKYGVLEYDRPHDLIHSSCGAVVQKDFMKEFYAENLSPGSSNGSEIMTKNSDECGVENAEIECGDPFASDLEESNQSDKNFSKRPKANDTKEFTLVSNPKISQRKSNTKSSTAGTELAEYIYDCSKCSQSFRRFGSYRLHMNKKHGILGEPSTFSCSKCFRSFKSTVLLKRHVKIHRPLSEKELFGCPQCDRKFQSNYYVATHIKLTHEGARPFICEKCGKAISTQVALNDHMLTHTDYAPFECEVCKRGFKSQRRLKKHLDIHSSDNHTCSECGQQLSSRITLNRHKLVHSDAMNHKCDYCGRAFKRAISLKDHLLLHSGLKPYSCEFCDRTFANSSNCRIHMKRIHPNEWRSVGPKSRAKNVPNLAVLKSVVSSAENLVPVVSKQSGNFAFGKKPKAQLVDGGKSYNEVRESGSASM